MTLKPVEKLVGLRCDQGDMFSLAALVILLPLGVFAASLQPLPGALVVVGLGLAILSFTTGGASGPMLSVPFVRRDFLVCLAGAFGLCILGGQGHFFYSTWDWMSRDAVLADLVGQSGLPFYRLDGQDYVLRAPTGMYLLPALFGRFAGLVAAHYVMLAQNALLLAAILYLASRLARGAKVAVIAGLIFYSPLDIIPRMALDLIEAKQSGGSLVLSPLTMFWNPMVPLWGNVPSLFWAPNHALPGWLFAIAFLYHLQGMFSLARLGLLFVGSLLWSPLAMIGAAPFLAYAVVRALRARWPDRDELLAVSSALCLMPLALYLKMDAGALVREWMVAMPRFWGWYGLMLVFALPQVWLLLADRRSLPPWRRPALFLATAVILVMTTYRFGAQAGDNDMAMRCTIVPMFVLAFLFADQVAAFGNRGGWVAALATLFVTVGAVTGAMEIRRAIADPAWRINDCNLLTAMEKASPGFVPINYIARLDRVPAGLVADKGFRAERETRKCWPGYPLAQE